ncbi:hypothetical protein [Chitinimonas sp.]|uniref:adenylate/guanylate cyclase domain-containing protein n=1 Tax=Chitinimonas sp. TaxID=1934313 RepID=UPI0035B14836
MFDRTNRTLICSVVFLDIVEYSMHPVSEQMQLKERFNALLHDALLDIAVNDRILLDTGDGAAISFLGDPEDALFVVMNLRDASRQLHEAGQPLTLRIGVNLGPVKLVKDVNGRPNLLGDGINVAQRIMGFAEPGGVLVSRSYFEVVSCLSDEYARLFNYEGAKTDKHVRAHEIYTVGYSEQVQPPPGGRRRSGRRTHALIGRELRAHKHFFKRAALAGVGLAVLVAIAATLFVSRHTSPLTGNATTQTAASVNKAGPAAISTAPTGLPPMAPVSTATPASTARPPAATSKPAIQPPAGSPIPPNTASGLAPKAGDSTAGSARPPESSAHKETGAQASPANGPNKASTPDPNAKPSKRVSSKPAAEKTNAPATPASKPAAASAGEKRECPTAECGANGRPKRDR